MMVILCLVGRTREGDEAEDEEEEDEGEEEVVDEEGEGARVAELHAAKERAEKEK